MEPRIDAEAHEPGKCTKGGKRSMPTRHQINRRNGHCTSEKENGVPHECNVYSKEAEPQVSQQAWVPSTQTRIQINSVKRYAEVYRNK